MKGKAKDAVTIQTPTPAEAGLAIGDTVRHTKRHTGFGVTGGSGTIESFIEPRPGWHRALVSWTEDETEQFIDTDKLELHREDAPVVVARQAAMPW